MSNPLWFYGLSDVVLHKIELWIKSYKMFLDAPETINKSKMVRISSMKIVVLDPVDPDSSTVSVPIRLAINIYFSVNELNWLHSTLLADDPNSTFQITNVIGEAHKRLSKFQTQNNGTGQQGLWLDVNLEDLIYLRDCILYPLKQGKPTCQQEKALKENIAKGNW